MSALRPSARIFFHAQPPDQAPWATRKVAIALPSALALERRLLAGRQANEDGGAARVRSLRGDFRRAVILPAIILRRRGGIGVVLDDRGHDAAGLVALNLVGVRAAGQPGKRGRNERPSQHENPSRPRSALAAHFGRI